MARPVRGPVCQVFFMPCLNAREGWYRDSDLRGALEDSRSVWQDIPYIKAALWGSTLRRANPPLGRWCWDTGGTAP